MIDRTSCYGGGKDCRRENVCIDTMQVLDSCRDKDCYENVRVYLTEFGQDIIEKTGNIRVKETKVISTDISTSAVQFNKGFFQITIRVYTKIVFEACICQGKIQEFEGIAVTEKKVVLYGGEGTVRTFKSRSDLSDNFCTVSPEFSEGSNKPTVVFETVDPIALSFQIKTPCKCFCCCHVDELPSAVTCNFQGCLVDHPSLAKHLYVSLGFFSVIRVERKGQFIVNATEFCIPDKECPVSSVEDPCSAFEKMAFPISDFCQVPGKPHSFLNDYSCSSDCK